MFLEF